MKREEKSATVVAATFESQLARLQESLKRLERGDLSLDESLSEYEQGLKMLKSCYSYLDEAERKIELMTKSEAEGVKLQPFHHESWEPRRNGPKKNQ